MNNVNQAQSIIQKLTSQGVQTFCICPSSRNAPFVEVLTSSKGFHLFQFFDERSAAFFALGRAQRDHSPVCVVTTSGTAVCELLPAVCEGYYTATPLILLTADRPRAYKDTAAPQCIEQPEIFSNFITQQWDLENSHKFDLSFWNFSTPIHINVRFDEPLLNSHSLSQIKNRYTSQENYFLRDQKLKDVEFSRTPFSFKEIEEFSKLSKKPIVIVSKLSLSLVSYVESLLLKWNLPVYAEPLSQIRENPQLQHLILQSGEEILQKLFEQKIFDSVIRIGNAPVLRFWRDIEKLNIPSLSFSPLSFPCLKSKKNVVPLVQFLQTPLDLHLNSKHTQEVLRIDAQNLTQKKNSEQEWIQWLSLKIPEKSHIFLGNSLPIREWDTFATRNNKKFIFSGNRGANGIDGIVSTFLGLCSKSRKNYCILGDLSLLYDLSAFWILDSLKEYQIQFIVMNNFGGQIFKDKFRNPYYLNTHKIQFEHLALLWKINYQKLTSPQNSLSSAPHSLIEIPIHETHAHS